MTLQEAIDFADRETARLGVSHRVYWDESIKPGLFRVRAEDQDTRATAWIKGWITVYVARRDSMYKLTLTRDERKAFDWIGDRYATGNEWSALLWEHAQPPGNAIEWDNPEDITFEVPESVAWELRDLADSEDGRFSCFAPELVAKLETFLDSIV